MAQATILKLGQYRHLIRATRAISRCPERDVQVLLMGIHMGMHVSEFAQIEVGDFMFFSGTLRQWINALKQLMLGHAGFGSGFTSSIAHLVTIGEIAWLTKGYNVFDALI